MSLITDLVRFVNADRKFRLEDRFEFVSFDDASLMDIEENKAFPDLLEISARVRIPFEGEVPESYKILNLIISEWVERNLGQLTDAIHAKLKEYFSSYYPESDPSALDELDNTAIWTDQIDYMPVVDEDSNAVTIDIELVLHGEPIE